MPTHPPERPAPERAAASTEHATHADLARSVWTLMSAFVLGNDPSEELREALGLGRGAGRIRALISLTGGPISLAELAERTGVDPPYATIIVNELLALGLVSRSADDRDRRRKSVELTRRGRAAAGKAQDIIARPPAVLADLPTTELATLLALLNQVSPRSDTAS